MGLLEKTTINADASVSVARRRKTTEVMLKFMARKYAISTTEKHQFAIVFQRLPDKIVEALKKFGKQAEIKGD